MAAIDPIHVPCPACGETITIPASATPGGKQPDGSLTVNVGLDHEPIREHADQHRAEERHTCPRRAETGHDKPDSPFVGSGTNLDTWRTDPAGPYCSYCGSLQPDRFMELVRAGWTVGPTDKSYKAYLSEDEASQRQAKFYFQHLSAEQQDEFIELHNAKRIKFAYPGGFYVTPFFAQRRTPEPGAE
jgi:hypothetical protein